MYMHKFNILLFLTSQTQWWSEGFYVECINLGYIQDTDWAAYIVYCGSFIINTSHPENLQGANNILMALWHAMYT